jgi:tetratricopeptide (TPR) repeat protein
VWLAGCLALALALWFSRRQFGWRPILAVAFFAAALSPMLGFVPLYTFYFSYVADHYQYLACLGLMALAAGGAALICDRCRMPSWQQVTAAMVVLTALGVLTFRQSRIYKDPETLWNDTLKKNPHSWLAHSNVARWYGNRNRLDLAEEHYRAALAINPEHESSLYNLGNLLAHEGRYEEAVTQYRAALQINPEKADAHNNLGFVLHKLDRTNEAIAEYERALLCQPDYPDAYYNLGNALAAEHEMDAALRAYQRALHLAPDSERIRNRLRSLGAGPN